MGSITESTHQYRVQYYIKTLNENYVNVTNRRGMYKYPNFSLNGIRFEPYSFTFSDGHIDKAWIAYGRIKATDARNAIIKFKSKLQEVIERISFVGQAYITGDEMSYLVLRDDEIGLFRYTYEDDPVPLMFMQSELQSLKILLRNNNIPRNFYRFWNEAVNNSNYFGKLAMMFSAVDSFRRPDGSIDKSKRKDIFGVKLEKKLYQVNDRGLRHRLIHGLKISEGEEKYYWQLIHRAVIEWFNKGILQSHPLKDTVVGPQRNFSGNFYGGWLLLKQKSPESQPLNLKNLLELCNGSELKRVYEEYEWIHKDPEISEFWNLKTA